MVKNEEYKNLLKSFISCVSHGDYYSIKELSKLQLEKIEEQEQKIKKEINGIKGHIELRKCKTRTLEELNSIELIKLLKNYSIYITRKIEKANNIQLLQKETLTVEEFIKKI